MHVSKTRKLLLTLLTLSLVGSVAAVGTFSAFFSKTENTGNNYDAGTVFIADNDAGSALYNVTNREPGDVEKRCIKVTYGGTLGSDVKLYVPDAIAASVGAHTNLKITSGTGAAADCADFNADTVGTPTVYSGTLAGFQSSHNAWNNGKTDFPLLQTKWNTNDAVTYQFELELADDNAANKGSDASYVAGSDGYKSGTHKWVFEAQNQNNNS